MRKEAKRSQVSCTATECPQVRAFLRGEAGTSLYMPREQALRDTLGNYWCTACHKRYELINWAASHTWPEIKCPPYAVAGGDHELWKTAVFLGHEELIETLYTFIFGEDMQRKEYD